LDALEQFLQLQHIGSEIREDEDQTSMRVTGHSRVTEFPEPKGPVLGHSSRRTFYTTWVRESSQFEPPAGPPVRFAPLAVADVDANGVWSQVRDCRRRFPPLTGLIHFYYVGGYGQEVAPDPLPPTGQQFLLPQPLEVGVSNWYWPVGARG
jgi:hypothetical protein